MRLAPLLLTTGDLLRTFRSAASPADAVAREFFREHRSLGSHDRRLVGDAFYHALRHLRRVDRALATALAGEPVLAGLSRSTGFPIDEAPNDRVWSLPRSAPEARQEDRWIDAARAALSLVDMDPSLREPVIDTLAGAWPGASTNPDGSPHRLQCLERACEAMDLYGSRRLRAPDLPLAFSFPDWLWSLLGPGMPGSELAAMATALNSHAPVTLRVNTLRTTRAEYEAVLAAAGIDFEPARHSPDALHLKGRIAQGALPGLEDGSVEMHDEGSQLVSIYCQPEPGMRIIDACAGAGGKALHLAALMQDRGEILVSDAVPSRLKNLWPRASRAGASIIKALAPEALKRTPEPSEQADIVLVDAPCSGTGTLRRHPELRWRLTREVVQERARLQYRLLREWARWVKPGGCLVYATCSLLSEENTARIEEFLREHPTFERMPVPLQEPLASWVDRRGDLVLLPHRHGCDGFYAARMRKAE